MLHQLGESKTRGAVVGALGHLMAGEPHGPFRNLVLRHLFGLAAIKDVDLHLTVGEALALIGAAPGTAPDCVAGASPNAADADGDADIDAANEAGSATAEAGAATADGGVLLPPLPPVVPPKKAGVDTGVAAGSVAAAAARKAAAATATASAGGALMGYVLRKLLDEFMVAWAPLVRQASTAWLLGLLQTRGDAVEVRAVAGEVQKALVALLADANEATQELAARGLSLLFERCDEATQEKIVKELVGALASTRTAAAGASGGEMATFTELSEIANNAGQPELVYKLMELSTASAMWNTRKGVAFALAGQSRQRLEAHLVTTGARTL